MATQVTPDVEIIAPEGSVEVVELEAGTEIVNLKPVKEAEVSVTGEKPVAIAGKQMADSTVTGTAKKGETAEVVLQTKTFKNSEVTVDGKGSLDLTVNTGSFKKSTIEGGKKADSVSFGNQTTVKKANIDLGKGDDTVTFKANTSFKGKTKIDLGNKGSDVVEFAEAPKGGKVVVSNFDKNDTLVVGGETFTYDDLKGGAEVSGIKIKFND